MGKLIKFQLLKNAGKYKKGEEFEYDGINAGIKIGRKVIGFDDPKHFKPILKKNYIVIPKLPKEQQEPLNKWLWGQTIPCIEAEGKNKMKCCYVWDYEQWLQAWEKGQVAQSFD